MPEQVTTAWWKEERGERIFVDYNQTARDRTIASAYSVRPPPARPVSAPLRWEEVDDVEPERFRYRDHARALRRTGRCARGYGRPRLLVWRPSSNSPTGDEHDGGLGDLPYPPEHPKMPGEPKRVQPSRARHKPEPEA